MATAEIKATSIMTYDPDNTMQYVNGQVVFHNGSFYTIDNDDPEGIPATSDDFTLIDFGGTTNYNANNTANYQQGQLVNEGDNVYYVKKDNPSGTPGSSDDYVPLTGGDSSGASFTVSPGTGASGTTIPFDAQNSNLTFAISKAAVASGLTNININIVKGASGPVIVFDGSSLAKMVDNLMVTQTYDPGKGEQDTGATYHGKPVFRRAFEFTTNRAAESQDDRMLIDSAGYVDAIVNTGGYWMTGNGVEKYPVNAAYVSPKSLYGFAYVDTGNKLVFRSNSSLNRNGSVESANNFVWVDYTRVDSTAPVAPSAV